MYQSAKIMYMRCITPLHVGCGNDLGVVDLPIQREKHTGYPKIESSGLKGCVREYFEDKAEMIDIDKNKEAEICVHKLFGYDRDSKSKHKEDIDKIFTDNSQYAGAVGFSDGRILLFPVKSAKGIFAWITCPSVLNKWLDEAKLDETRLCKKSDDLYESISSITFNPKENEALCSGTTLLIKGNKDESDKIYLEEYEFNASQNNDVQKIAEKLSNVLQINDLKCKLVIVDDNAFYDFVTMSTEVITRTKINNETGAVQEGALFTEEYLPSETVMYAMVLFSPTFLPNSDKNTAYLKNLTFKDVKTAFFDTMSEKGVVLQIGAGATIGKGITKINWEVNANES